MQQLGETDAMQELAAHAIHYREVDSGVLASRIHWLGPTENPSSFHVMPLSRGLEAALQFIGGLDGLCSTFANDYARSHRIARRHPWHN